MRQTAVSARAVCMCVHEVCVSAGVRRRGADGRGSGEDEAAHHVNVLTLRTALERGGVER